MVSEGFEPAILSIERPPGMAEEFTQRELRGYVFSLEVKKIWVFYVSEVLECKTTIAWLCIIIIIIIITSNEYACFFFFFFYWLLQPTCGF